MMTSAAEYNERVSTMQQSLAGSTILIADDEPSIRELFQDIFEPEGVTVYLASSGKEALSIIETKQLDLAILDIRMPAPDGMEILRHLRQKHSMLPVFIITAHDFASLMQEVQQSGANHYITKPFDPEMILTLVVQTLQ